MRPKVLLSLLVLSACDPNLPPSGSYYEENIAPTLAPSCARSLSGCHLPDARGAAAGNLDLSSYDSLMRRADVLDAYGPYPRPLLLLKAGEPVDISVETLDPPDPARPEERFVRITTDIRHTGGTSIAEGSTGFGRLLQWMRSGHTRTGVEAERVSQNDGECAPGPGTAAGFSADDPPASPALFARFVSDVQPILAERCAGSGCHGASLADYHLSCGQSEPEQRWNFWISLQQLSEDASTSELLRKPLATSNGGSFHGGGDTFRTREDPAYATLLAFAEEVAATAPELVREADVTEGYRFFANRVQPILVREGCMALACHSPVSIAFNLRGGSGGSFSRYARRRNYALTKRFLAFESTDVRQSRIVRKNLFPAELGGEGIVHRGGSLFEDFGTPVRGDECATFDADAGDLNEVPSYCVIERWHAIEREQAIARGELPSEPLRAVAWVARLPGMGETTDVDAYRPGADLRIATAALDAQGSVTLDPSRSVLALCGLDPRTADVRGTAGAWDGSRLAFGVRSSQNEPYAIWELVVDNDTCAPVSGLADPQREHGGILSHDFDPAYAPDGRIVFASTRTGARTPASLAPNANLFVLDRDTAAVRQLTFLLNQELSPQFMEDGRMIYTLEKRERDFHMLALRRQNLDGGDYHPLYASRNTLGFESATEVAQLPDLNFAFVAGPLHTPEGAGSIVVFNRSIGPDQLDRDPGDRQYLHSMRIVGRSVLHGGTGLYRSPAALPTGRVLASCAAGVTDVMASSVDFDLCEIDVDTLDVRVLSSEPGVAEVEAVALYGRVDRGVLVSDGAGIDHPEIVDGANDAIVHFNDFPMIETLMFDNRRTGRRIDRRIGGFEVLAHEPPPASATSFDSLGADVVEDSLGRFYSRRAPLGWAPLFDDGSTRVRLPGGQALSFRMTDAEGEMLELEEGMPFSGPLEQREHEQYFPGERIQRSIGRRFFNGTCGGCHGSITGRELDLGVNLDVITGASTNVARDASPFDLME